MDCFEDVVNKAYAIEYANKVKEYCKSNKNCNKCVFWIGCCQLTRHPLDWDLRRVDYGTDKGF